ncbi:MAG: ABC transporter substrate-binding protein [Leptolyngbyaceae cyanobacterium]
MSIDFRAWLAIALVTTLLSTTACQSRDDPRGLKLGTLLPITGDLSQYGTSMQDSASLLVETVNACGGVMGQPVKLSSQDDQTEPAAGTAAMTQLAEIDRVAGVVGAASSAVSSAAIEIAVRNQVVLISPASTSPVFTKRAKQGDFQGFWARTAPPDTYQGEALAKLAQNRGFKTVAILAVNNDYGNGLIASFVPAFEALGGRVVNKANPLRYAPESSSFDSEVGMAFRSNPDAVLLIAYPETGSLVLKTAYQQGWLGRGIQVIATDGLKEARIADLIGKNSAGQYIAAGLIGTAVKADGPALQQFESRFQARYRRSPKIYDPHTWDAAALLALAAEAARATSGAAVKAHLQEVANPPGIPVTDVCQGLALLRQGKLINYEGASGSVDLNQWGDVMGQYVIWTIAEDGRLTTVGEISIRGQ